MIIRLLHRQALLLRRRSYLLSALFDEVHKSLARVSPAFIALVVSFR